MAVEEPRRIALHRAAAQSWGEEVADTLFELVAPSGHELATRADIQGILDALDAMDRRWDERLAATEQRSDERVTTMEQRWSAEAATSRFELRADFERGLRETITSQTRTLVISQLGALVVIAGLAFGLGG